MPFEDEDDLWLCVIAAARIQTNIPYGKLLRCVNVTYPAQEARDENQPQPQRNTDGAQGGTVDCAKTTELTCDSTDSAQGGAVGCAGTTELTGGSTDSAQGGTAVVTPSKKRKRKKLKTRGPQQGAPKMRYANGNLSHESDQEQARGQPGPAF